MPVKLPQHTKGKNCFSTAGFSCKHAVSCQVSYRKKNGLIALIVLPKIYAVRPSQYVRQRFSRGNDPVDTKTADTLQILGKRETLCKVIQADQMCQTIKRFRQLPAEDLFVAVNEISRRHGLVSTVKIMPYRRHGKRKEVCFQTTQGGFCYKFIGKSETPECKEIDFKYSLAIRRQRLVISVDIRCSMCFRIIAESFKVFNLLFDFLQFIGKYRSIIDLQSEYAAGIGSQGRCKCGEINRHHARGMILAGKIPGCLSRITLRGIKADAGLLWRSCPGQKRLGIRLRNKGTALKCVLFQISDYRRSEITEPCRCCGRMWRNRAQNQQDLESSGIICIGEKHQLGRSRRLMAGSYDLAEQVS